MRRRAAKVLLVMLAALGTASVAVASFAARSSNTAGAAAATFTLGDDDGSVPLFDLSDLRPGTPAASRCLRVTRGGSAPSAVRLHANVTGPLASLLALKVERGSESTPSAGACTSFAPDAANYVGAGPGVVYAGRLDAYPASYATGLVDAPGAPEEWTAGESHVYRLTVTLADDPAAQGLSAEAAFAWEAR